RDAALVAVEGLEEEAVALRQRVLWVAHMAAHIAGFRDILDLDDFRTEVGELQRAEGTGTVRLNRDEAEASEGEHHAGFRCTSWRAMMMRCNSLVPSPMQSSGASR